LNCAFPFSQHCYALLRTQVSLLLLPSKRRPNDSFNNFPFLFFYSSRPAAQLEKYIKIKKRSLKYQHIGIDNRRLFFFGATLKSIPLYAMPMRFGRRRILLRVSILSAGQHEKDPPPLHKEKKEAKEFYKAAAVNIR
jgi:hypothetical protein